MGRTQEIGTLFELHQTGTYGGYDTNGDTIGAAWCIAGPAAPLIGFWTVDLRMIGPIREVYDFYGHFPFPFWGNQGLWGELAAHGARDLICEVEATGPGGAHFIHQWTQEDGWDFKPYIMQLTGDSPGPLTLHCGVANYGSHTLSASFLGEPLPWTPYSEHIGDQSLAIPGQYADVEVTTTGVSIQVESGGDERFNAAVTGVFEWPLKTRLVVDLRDCEGNTVAGKRVFAMFGPFSGDPDSPRLSRFLKEFQTPVDSVVDFPMTQAYQEVQFQHTFLESYSGNPSPPFPRIRRWGSQELLSGTGIVAVAIDREEFGLSALAARRQFVASLLDARNWPRSRFHEAAGVTRQTVARVRLPASLPIALEWEALSGTVDSGSLEAVGAGEFRAVLDPGFECRPYRFLATGISVPFELELRQGGVIKTYEGASRVDLARPLGTSELARSKRGEAIHRGVLAGRFEGIAGLTEVRVRFSDATVTPEFVLEADSGSLRWLGDGKSGSSADDALHVSWGEVDGMEAFRVPWRESIGTTLAELRARMGVEVADEDYSISADWAHRYDAWSPAGELDRVPAAGFRFLSNFEATADALEFSDVRMTLTGRGYSLYPGISQDEMVGGSEPFLCQFEAVWGPGVAATAVSGVATARAERPSQIRTWRATPFGVGSLDARVPHAAVDGSLSFVGRPESLPVSLTAMGQVVAFAGLGEPGAAVLAASAVAHPHAEWVEVVTDAEGVLVRTACPDRTERVVTSEGVSEAVLCRGRDARLDMFFVRTGAVWRMTTLAETVRWTEEEMITTGSEVAVARCPISGGLVAAIWEAGTWTAWLENDSEWAAMGVIVEADAARGGLVFAGEPGNALVFVVPIGDQIRRFESLDFGRNWEEI